MVDTNVIIIPYGLKTEYLTDPLGIDVQRPRFSWQLKSEKRGTMQHAYRVIVATSRELIAQGIGDVWDSGKVISSETVNVEYEGQNLLSRTSYWWRVYCYYIENMLGSASEIATFETAFYDRSDFVAKWIGAETSIASPIFRKEIFLGENISQARAYICGLGYYELYCNGQKVGDHVLDPNWTDYDNRLLQDLIYPHEDSSRKRALYVTYDMTYSLKSGINALGIMLGNGWYNQPERNVEGKMTYGSPKFWLQVHIKYENGKEAVFGSDSDWRCSSGPINFNNIYYGEIYDARLEQLGWSEPGFDDFRWHKAVERPRVVGDLKAQMSPSDKIIDTIIPVSVTDHENGNRIYDLGQNLSGWAQIKVSGAPGAKVVMRFAEELDELGALDFTSAGTEQQVQQDTYILAGKGMETYEPRFTWHGFRYVEVNLSPGITMDSLRGIVVHSAVKKIGSFSCSNSMFNRIFELYRWSQLSNLHGGVPSDCPHRERLGYTGDAQITTESAIFSFDMAAFYTKYIEDISDSQNPISGFVPHTAPFYGGGGGPGGWGCAAILMPWYMYLYYGDRRILEEHYTMMLSWMEYLSEHADQNGIIISEEPGSWCLGEWVVPHQFDKVEGIDDIFNMKVPAELVNTYYYTVSASIMTRVARILDDDKRERHFNILHGDLKTGMHQRFYNDITGSYASGIQGSDAFSIAADCVPEEKKRRVLENLVKNIMDVNGGTLDTGIFGTPVMLEVLAENGEAEVAYSILNQTRYPSYGYMLSQGATTLWECWEKENGSHNHPMLGSVVAWMFKYITGLRPDKNIPGFKHMIIKPYLFKNIDYAEASYKSVRGDIGIKWERIESKIILQLEIPCNCSADVYLPVKGLDNIIEGRVPIFDKGKLIKGLEGISSFSMEEDGVRISVKSGQYRFEI
jgi:alpha-L-rhamnosidase